MVNSQDMTSSIANAYNTKGSVSKLSYDNYGSGSMRGISGKHLRLISSSTSRYASGAKPVEQRSKHNLSVEVESAQIKERIDRLDHRMRRANERKLEKTKQT